MIRACGLSVKLGGTPVLSGIDLAIAPGGWTSVIGPNGSGKTTLLRACAGLVGYSGELVVAGLSPGTRSRAALARVLAYVPQHPVFPLEMRVRDYVLLGRTPHIWYLGTESGRDLSCVSAVLEQVGLGLLAGRPLGSLSGGELQRAILARALAQEPAVLLLDEPTTGLDIGYQQQVLELIDWLRAERRLTVLSAIHDLTLAGQFSEHVLLIDGGRTCASGPPADVLTEELLLRHYGSPVRIVNHAGGMAVIPVRETAGSHLSGAREAGAPTGPPVLESD